MTLDADICYRALQARDLRFDGVFYVGVKSTGIYCRPICPARTPRADRCTFFPSAAAAEQSRFRPCLRCRPELAPGQAPVDTVSRTALLASSLIQGGEMDDGKGVEDLARQLSLSSRQLRRTLQATLGVTPIQLAQTRRLLLAKQLLRESSLPIIDVAFASGFSSLRRFNALFQSQYGLSPRALRREVPQERSGGLRLSLAYRPPLAWEPLLGFLAGRAIPGVERIADNEYSRAVRIGTVQGWLKVRPDFKKHRLMAELSPSLIPILSQVLSRLRSLFDLDAHPDKISERLQTDSKIGATVVRFPGLRIPGAFDGFEIAMRAVVGQQVSVRAASTIMHRLVERLGVPLEIPAEGLSRTSPTPEIVASASTADLSGLGLTGKRIETLRALGRAVADKEIALAPGVSPEAMIPRLCEIPGIGDWTAQYLAMRALRWPDAFAAGDLILRRLLGDGNARKAIEHAEAWRPWRAYGAIYTWQTANIGGG